VTYTLTAGSLFSGVGMMDYAFAQAGFDIRFQVEVDPYCRKVLVHHAPTYWPDATLYADVRDVTGEQLGYVDALFGGFPCQDVSATGTRAGIQAGTRSGLWFEFKRIIGDIRPRVVLLENVAAITRRDGIKVITGLTEMGYDTKWGVISAASVGAPHQRERWWCVAFNVGHANCLGSVLSSATKKFRSNEERHYQKSQQIWYDELYTSIRNGQMEHDHSQRLSECNSPSGDCPSRYISGRYGAAGAEREWYEAEPRLDRSPDGPAVRVDRRHGLILKHQWAAAPNASIPPNEVPRMAPEQKNTNNRIKALGNGLIPGIAYPIALYLKGLLLQSN
jgi:DNA (cytosine-5)-methyltransferase 1